MVSPPSLPRHMPEKLTTAPTSLRPFVSAAISRAISKSDSWMRIVGLALMGSTPSRTVSSHAQRSHVILEEGQFLMMRYPPVIGGEKAISRAPAVVAPGLSLGGLVSATV